LKKLEYQFQTYISGMHYWRVLGTNTSKSLVIVGLPLAVQGLDSDGSFWQEKRQTATNLKGPMPYQERNTE
jgi:hypothetical protein